MLRITEKERSDLSVTYLVEGRVGKSGLEEITAVCSRTLEAGSTPVLDLSQVLFVERSAVSGFRSLRSKPVRMINCSPFLVEQLKFGDCNA